MKKLFLLYFGLLIGFQSLATHTTKMDDILSVDFPAKPKLDKAENYKKWYVEQDSFTFEVLRLDYENPSDQNLHNPEDYQKLYQRGLRELYSRGFVLSLTWIVNEQMTPIGYAYGMTFTYYNEINPEAKEDQLGPAGRGLLFYHNQKLYQALAIPKENPLKDLVLIDQLKFNTEIINQAVRERTPYAGEGRKEPTGPKVDYTVPIIASIIVFGVAIGLIFAFRK